VWSILNHHIQSGPILLVDDDVNDIALALRALDGNHVKSAVIVVRDGIEALDYLFESGKYAGQTTIRPEIVLLDLHLPKVGGLKLLGLLRAAERTRALPVIVLTSSRDEQERIDTHNLGTISYLRKPINFRNLFEAVSRCGLHKAA
jgi:two-component system response regulator